MALPVILPIVSGWFICGLGWLIVMFHVIVVCLLLVGLGGFGDVVISVNVWCLLVCVWRAC